MFPNLHPYEGEGKDGGPVTKEIFGSVIIVISVIPLTSGTLNYLTSHVTGLVVSKGPGHDGR